MIENAKCEVKGKILTITIDLTKELRPSSSGKNILVAVGKDSVGEGVTVQVNAYKKPKPS